MWKGKTGCTSAGAHLQPASSAQQQQLQSLRWPALCEHPVMTAVGGKVQQLLHGSRLVALEHRGRVRPA